MVFHERESKAREGQTKRYRWITSSVRSVNVPSLAPARTTPQQLPGKCQFPRSLEQSIQTLPEYPGVASSFLTCSSILEIMRQTGVELLVDSFRSTSPV
jgi:hypothetical protein